MQRTAGVLSTQATTGNAYQDLRIQLLAFLGLYKTKVDLDASSSMGMAKNGAQAFANLVSFATSSKPKYEVLDDLYAKAKSEIELCKTDDDWLKLVKKLREGAIAAQKQKTTDGLSRLSENLDALASMVVVQLRKFPWYVERVRNLLLEYKKINDPIEGDIVKNHENSQGKGVEDLNIRSREILNHLAEECNSYALSVLRQHEQNEKKLSLSPLPTPQLVQKYNTLHINFANPLIYQINYANILFDEQYRYMNNVGRSYEEFLNFSIITYLEKKPPAAVANPVNASTPTGTNGQTPAQPSGAVAPTVKTGAPESVAPVSAPAQQVAPQTMFQPTAPAPKQGLNGMLQEDYQEPSGSPTPHSP